MPGLGIKLGISGRQVVYGGSKKTIGILCAQRCQMPTGVATVGNNATLQKVYYSHPKGAISDLELIWAAWYIDDSFTVVATDNITIKAYVEYPTGTFTPVTFSGASSGTLLSAGYLVGKCAVKIPANTPFNVRTVNISGAMKNFAISELPATQQALKSGDGYSSSDLGNSGTVPQAASANVYGPMVINGTVDAANARSAIVLGDSLTNSYGDTSSLGTNKSSGYWGRFLAPQMAYLRMGKNAMAAQNAVANFTGKLSLFFPRTKFSDVILAYGANDLRLGRSQAQLFADYQTLIALVPTGVKRHLPTITTRTTSTNAWSTTANQTERNDGNYTNLGIINDAIRAGLANFDNVIEIADQIAVTHNSRIWKAPPSRTAEGIHPNSYSCAEIAAALPII